MTSQDRAARSIALLTALLEKGDLPEKQQSRGTTLLRRLTSPVRLSVMGMPGSGKTELVNLLACNRAIPTGLELPTLELVWGDVPSATMKMADGSKVESEWPIADDFDWADVVFLQVAMPLDPLKQITILEIVTDGSAEDLSSAMNWAIPRTDMALWCTQSFNRLEHALWVQVPDSLKDHGFLVLAKADQIAARGRLAEEVSRLRGVASEEFYGLFAVATHQFLAAIEPDGHVDPDVRAASGAAELIDAVMADVDRGRRADLDGAEIFLDRHSAELAAVDAQDAVVAKQEPDVPPPPAATEDVAGATALTDALTFIMARGSEIAARAGQGDDVADEVLGDCSAALEDLVEKVSDVAAVPVGLRDEIESASEMVVLMQLEGGIEPAADAATVLLQLTRELELAVAA